MNDNNLNMAHSLASVLHSESELFRLGQISLSHVVLEYVLVEIPVQLLTQTRIWFALASIKN